MRDRDVLIKDGYVEADAEQERGEPAVEPRGHRARWPQALLPAAGSPRRHGFGFWAVAFTFMMLVAFTTVPSPLYSIYRARDGFSSFVLTVIFAVYAPGMATMLLGLAAVVGAVWLSTPSLALFIVGGAISMAGAGTVFRGAIADVIRISPPDKRAEIVAAAYVASPVGLSVPIIGAGIALTEGVSSRVTLLALAILIAAGIALAAIKLLGGAPRRNLPAELANSAERAG